MFLLSLFVFNRPLPCMLLPPSSSYTSSPSSYFLPDRFQPLSCLPHLPVTHLSLLCHTPVRTPTPPLNYFVLEWPLNTSSLHVLFLLLFPFDLVFSRLVLMSLSSLSLSPSSLVFSRPLLVFSSNVLFSFSFVLPYLLSISLLFSIFYIFFRLLLMFFSFLFLFSCLLMPYSKASFLFILLSSCFLSSCLNIFYSSFSRLDFFQSSPDFVIISSSLFFFLVFSC